MLTNKEEITDELRSNVLEDMQAGVKWKEIATKYNVATNIVRSIHAKELTRKKHEAYENGTGQIKYYRGERETDGEAHPVKTFHISELQK